MNSYDEIYEREKYCADCDDKKDRLEGCKEFLEEIVKQIYSRNEDELKLEILDHCFEELCYKLKVRPANGQPQIMRRRNPVYILSEIMQQEGSEFLKTLIN